MSASDIGFEMDAGANLVRQVTCFFDIGSTSHLHPFELPQRFSNLDSCVGSEWDLVDPSRLSPYSNNTLRNRKVK